MKSVLLVLLAVASNSVSVMAGCQRMQFTFNFKPWFPPGLADEYVCGDMENDFIEDSIKKHALAKMEDMGYTNVIPSVLRKNDSCPQHNCDIQPGDACLPYCVDISFCTSQDLEDSGTSVLSVAHVGQMQQYQIDEFRKDLPECLGIKNKFMMDMHFTFATSS